MDPWESSWANRNQDQTHSDAKDVLEKSNVLGDIYGAFSGGHKDPIQHWGDQQYGGMMGNEGSFNTIKWQKGDEDVYRQMDEAQWRDLADMRQDNQAQWIQNRRNALASGAKAGTFWDPKTGKTASSADPVDEKINEFYKRMMGPLDMNDPEVQMATNNALSMSNRQAANRGIQGGMSVAGATNSALQAQTALAGQRHQMGLEALGTMNSRDLTLKGMSDTNRLQGWQSQNARDQAMGGMIGGMTGIPGGAEIGAGMSGSAFKPTVYRGGGY